MGEAKRRKQLDPTFGTVDKSATATAKRPAHEDWEPVVDFSFPSGVVLMQDDVLAVGGTKCHLLYSSDWLSFEDLKQLTQHYLSSGLIREISGYPESLFDRWSYDGSTLAYEIEDFSMFIKGLATLMGLDPVDGFNTLFVDALAWGCDLMFPDNCPDLWDGDPTDKTFQSFEDACRRYIVGMQAP